MRMIVLHRPKLVFVRTRKTAGTAIEIALSRMAGPDDIITALSPRDEQLRARWGGRGPQNHLTTPATAADPSLAPGTRPGVAWWNHMPLTVIRERLDLTGYRTAAFDRNPFDKVVSLYFHRHRTQPRISLTDFVASGEAFDGLNWPLYAADGTIEVDLMGHYETLEADLRRLASHLHLPHLPLPHAKAHFRPPATHHRDLLSPTARQLIEAVFAPELALHGYTW